jgi:hypothetical protein
VQKWELTGANDADILELSYIHSNQELHENGASGRVRMASEGGR